MYIGLQVQCSARASLASYWLYSYWTQPTVRDRDDYLYSVIFCYSNLFRHDSVQRRMFTDLNIPIPYRGGHYSHPFRGGMLAESVGKVWITRRRNEWASFASQPSVTVDRSQAWTKCTHRNLTLDTLNEPK